MSRTSIFAKILGRRKRPHPPSTHARHWSPPAAPGDQERRLPRFKGTARDSERKPRPADDKLDQLRLKLQRAFSPSQPVNDVRMFAGRKDVLLTLIRAIEEQQLHAVIFGDRGIGKTSLLHVFTQLAREARYIVRYASCSETSDFDATFRAIVAGIPLLYHADFDPTSEEAERGATLTDLLSDKPLTVAEITEIFDRLSGTRVLIILDEFDRAHSADFKRSLAELIKSLSDRAVRVQIVIAGVAANLTELVEHIPSIRRNVLGIPVRMMNEAEITELIELGEAVSGLIFEKPAVSRIVDAALGSPYVAGLLAHHAAGRAIDRRRQRVSEADVVDAVQRALTDVKLRLSPRAEQQLAAIESRASADALAVLAGEALRHFGVVPADGRGDERLAHTVRLAAEIGLVTPTSIGDLSYQQFVDDSAALYLWLASRIAPQPGAVRLTIGI